MLIYWAVMGAGLAPALLLIFFKRTGETAFALSLLAFFQMVFWPGWLAISACRLRLCAWQFLLFALILSLTINGTVVFISSLLGLYGRPFVFTGLALEFLLTAYLFHRRALAWPAAAGFFKACHSSLQAVPRALAGLHGSAPARQTLIKLVKPILLLAAVISLAGLARQALFLFGSIFEGWDAANSWNRWANDFFGGRMPQGAGYYPQLWPAVWSLNYQIVGHPWQYLSRFSVIYLILCTAFLLCGEGILRRQAGLLLGFILLANFYLSADLYYLWDGLMETPVALLALASFYSLHLALEKRSGAFLALGWSASLAGSVTKQSGLFTLLIYIVLAATLGREIIRPRWRQVLLPGLLSLLVVTGIPYAYFRWAIVNGYSGSNVTDLIVNSGLHDGRTFLERLPHSFVVFTGAYFKPLFLWFPFLEHLLSNLPAGLVIFSVTAYLLYAANKAPLARYLLAGFVAPLYIIWAFCYSYSERNVFVVVPTLLVLIGTALPSYLRPACRAVLWLWGKKSACIYIAIGLLCTFLWLGGITFPAERINNRHAALEEKLGGHFGEYIAQYIRHNHVTNCVATDFQYLGCMAAVKHLYVGQLSWTATSVDSLIKNRDIGFIYYIGFNDRGDGKARLRELVRLGTLEIIESNDSFALDRIVK